MAVRRGSLLSTVDGNKTLLTTDPRKTFKAIVDAAVNYEQTFHAILEDISTKLKTPRGIGHLVGDVLQTLFTGRNRLEAVGARCLTFDVK